MVLETLGLSFIKYGSQEPHPDILATPRAKDRAWAMINRGAGSGNWGHPVPTLPKGRTDGVCLVLRLGQSIDT